MTDIIISILKILILLPLVLLLAYFSLKYGLGKANGFSFKSQMKLLDRLALGPKCGICVIKILDKYYLVSATEKEVKVIKELEDYPENEPTEFAGFKYGGLKTDLKKKFNRFSK